MRIRVAGIVVAMLVGLSTVALAQSGEAPTVLYRLQAGSSYEEGCYGSCLCPILQAPLEGTFGLTLLPNNGPLALYAVETVTFHVPALDRSIEGSGFYTPAGEFNQLQLDLQFDDGAAWYFSSGGLVPAGAEFPEIDIVVSVNQFMECFDYVLHIVAAPDASPYGVPALEVSQAELSWSAIPESAGYDVVCGDLSHLRDSGDFVTSTDLCLGDDYAQTSMAYDMATAVGAGLWFLVREAGGSWDSAAGRQLGSRDAGINASPPACP